MFSGFPAICPSGRMTITRKTELPTDFPIIFASVRPDRCPGILFGNAWEGRNGLKFDMLVFSPPSELIKF